MNAPKRWKEPGSDASPAVRSVLAYASSRAPDAAYVAALTGSVLAQLSTPGPALAAGSAVKASATLASSKLLGITLVAALAGAGGATLYLTRDDAAPDKQSSPRSALVAPQAPHAPRREAEPLQETAVPVLKTPAPAARVKTERSERSARASRARSEASMDELGLLQAARLARSSSETRALKLLREHERRFPDSLLREERDALLIELLARSEPRAATQRAADFLQRFPNSPYRERFLRMSRTPQAPEIRE